MLKIKEKDNYVYFTGTEEEVKRAKKIIEKLEKKKLKWEYNNE